MVLQGMEKRIPVRGWQGKELWNIEEWRQGEGRGGERRVHTRGKVGNRENSKDSGSGTWQSGMGWEGEWSGGCY